MAHNNLGKMALLRGDLATAIAEYAADERIESALAARDPKDNNQRENLLLVRGILGRTLALTGNQQAAIEYLRDASAIAAQLHAADPDNAGIREDVALCALQLARVLRMEGDTVGADAQAARATSILAALTRQDPANTGWRREYAEARLEQAEQARIAGQAGVAQDLARSALALLDPLLADEPDDRPTLLSTMSARLLLANLTGRSDATGAAALRAGTLDAIGRQQTGDPRLDALRVSAMVLALATGIFYFTWVVAGVSMSAGFAVLIIGVPFVILYFGSVRVLSLVEGRLVEVMLGERMIDGASPVSTWLAW